MDFGISIHAPRVGSDESGLVPGRVNGDFNPRSPCGERHRRFCSKGGFCLFQSTLPVWGATDQSTSASAKKLFQSTLPVWGATSLRSTVLGRTMISIHAPRVGSDDRCHGHAGNGTDFNPRSPCGERHLDFSRFLRIDKFQSTLPVWGATAKMHRFFFCIFGKKGIFCDILQIGRHLQGIGRKRRGDFLSRSVRTSRGKYGYLAFAFRESGGLRENRRFYSQSVLFSFRIDCQGSRIADCPFRGP